MELTVGTCGFQRARRLHYMNLDGVEVQQTFYDPPGVEVLERWRSEAPSSFEFTVKAWMLVTHEYNKRLWRRLKRSIDADPSRFGGFKLTREVLWAWEVTLDSAEALRARVIVVQTPPGFEATRDNLRRVVEFFRRAPRRGFLIAWEPRGGWWSRRELLEEAASQAEIAIAGDPLRGRVPPPGQEMLYARLHGLGGAEVNYKYKYTDEDLARLKQAISGGWKRVYVMFNNIHAYDDAVRFKAMVKDGSST